MQIEFMKALKGDKINFVTNHGRFLETAIPEWRDMCFPQNNKYHIYDVGTHSLVAYEHLIDSADLITRIATLLHDIGKPHCYQDGEDGVRHFKEHGRVSAEMADDITKRMGFDDTTRKNIIQLVYYHDATFEIGKKYVRRWLNKIGEIQFRRLLELRIADIKGQNPVYQTERLEKIKKIKELLEEMLIDNKSFTVKDLDIKGSDLIEIGYKQGKQIGDVLYVLLNHVINKEISNDKERLLKVAKKLLKLVYFEEY